MILHGEYRYGNFAVTVADPRSRRRSMNGQGQDLKELLLQTDEEFHELAAKHHELEDRLHELTAKHYLSEPEQVEEVTLKKRKLQLKDRMEDILRRRDASRASVTRAVVFCRRTARRLGPRMSAARSGSTTSARRSWRGRSSASWRDAWCAASKPAQMCTPVIGSAS